MKVLHKNKSFWPCFFNSYRIWFASRFKSF